jgi:hypothetical protein
MYDVLGLEAVINVSQVADFQKRFGIVQQLNELEQQIRLKSNVVILTDEARQHLLALANSPLSDINFTAYNDLVCSILFAFTKDHTAGVLLSCHDTNNALLPVK